jgi:hypothetical protein
MVAPTKTVPLPVLLTAMADVKACDSPASKMEISPSARNAVTGKFSFLIGDTALADTRLMLVLTTYPSKPSISAVVGVHVEDLFDFLLFLTLLLSVYI